MMVSRSKHTVASLPKTITGDVQNYSPPTGFFNTNLLKTPSGDCAAVSPSIAKYNDQPIDANKALKVDVDGDCQADFFMQVFRTVGTTSADQVTRNVSTPTQVKPSRFDLGIRVYAIMADGSQPGNAWSNLSREPASLKLTNGEGDQRTQPLSVIYSSFSWSDQSSSLCDYPGVTLPRGCPARP
ncbi:MAG: hypothetical protein HC772_06695 [Leptolyngbyaceae cyanobacterium CRU_2_3]|nr:hypothetical protein [Leptolyngbyaceae cyanobacterium CRU_2_3]